MHRAKILIMGAAGRDFHNFNVVFRDQPHYEVVAFTAAQMLSPGRNASASSAAGVISATRGTGPSRRTRTRSARLGVAPRGLHFAVGAVCHPLGRSEEVWMTEATGGRWRPSRAGILNVWRYYDEVFTFHDGRLLLRGPNGSGKSKALELLLPFLFDANLSASRLSTFAQGARSMHWNLMGQGASGTTRVGFVWLELVRDEGADERFLTIGARLQASRSETRPRVDYFLADGRVGVDFELTADQTPLTAGALREQLTRRRRDAKAANA